MFMNYDELWPNGPKLIQSEDVFTLGTDAVMLSYFARTPSANKVCDLGTGSGIIALLLAWENHRMQVDGIEIQPQAVELARQNVELNALSSRINIIEGDIRMYRDMPGAGSYDLVVANPPYFAVNSGISVENDSIAMARDERTCTLKDVCAAAAHFTRWGGKFALVHRPERLAEVFTSLCSNGLEPKRMRFVQNKITSLPSLVLIESRRGGNPGLIIDEPLVLCDDNGERTYEVRRIYHRGKRHF